MDAYGYNALSGFFGSSSRKEQKQEEIAYLEKQLTLQQRIQAQETAANQASQKLIDESFKYAFDLTTGTNARKRDKDLVRQMSEDLLAPINEKIRQAGGYMKAKRLGIDQDLRDYQFALTNNDKVFAMKQTQEAIAKIYQFAGDEGTRKSGQTVPLAVYDNFIKWQNEEIDSFTWDGIGDTQLNFEFAKEESLEKEITETDILHANLMIFNDYERDLIYKGYSPEEAAELTAFARKNPGVLVSGDGKSPSYLSRRLGRTNQTIPQYGTKEVETSLGIELESVYTMFPSEGVSGSEIVAAKGWANYVDKIGANDRIASTIGFDERNPGLRSFGGLRISSAGAIGVDGQIDYKIFQAEFGDKMYDDDGVLKLQMNSGDLEGYYNEKGDLITDPTWIDNTINDLTINGLYLGAKVTIYDENNDEKSSFLLPEATADLNPLERARELNEKLNKELEDRNYKITPAYIAQLKDDDLTYFSDDGFYKEIIISDAEFAQLDGDKDLNEAMSKGRNQRAILKNQTKQSERKAEIAKSIEIELNNIYASGTDNGFKSIDNAYTKPFKSTLASNGIPPNMLPYVMADAFEATMVEARATNNSNVGSILQKVLQNFSTLAASEPEYYSLLQNGNVAAFSKYMESKKGKDYASLKKKYKLWSKYYNTQNK
mgnify:CR=1 FL=1